MYHTSDVCFQPAMFSFYLDAHLSYNCKCLSVRREMFVTPVSTEWKTRVRRIKTKMVRPS